MNRQRPLFISGFLAVMNVIAVQPLFAQFASGLPNAAGNQPIEGTASPSRAITGIQGDPNANPSGISAYGPSPTPWFGNDSVRQQLALTAEQNGAFMQNGWQAYQGYPTYNNDIRNIGQLQQSQGMATPYLPSGRPQVRVMSNPSTRGVANQLSQQYSNYQMYDNSGDNYGSVAQAAMEPTPSQRARFARQQRQQDHMAQYRSQFRMDPSLVSPRFSNGLDVSQQRFSTVIGPQRAQYDQTWNQMNGSAFDYPIDVYFTSGGTVAPAGQ